MSSTINRRTPKSSTTKQSQSLFFNDLSTPVTNRRSGSTKFTTPGQATVVSALWRENFANSDLSPPPLFTLQDRSDFSPESGVQDYPVHSLDPNSTPTRTPILFTPDEVSEITNSPSFKGGIFGRPSASLPLRMADFGLNANHFPAVGENAVTVLVGSGLSIISGVWFWRSISYLCLLINFSYHVSESGDFIPFETVLMVPFSDKSFAKLLHYL